MLLDVWGSTLPGPGNVVPGLFGARYDGWSSKLYLEGDRLLGGGLVLQAPSSAAPRIRGVAPVDKTGNPAPVEEGPLHWGHQRRTIDQKVFDALMQGAPSKPKDAVFKYPGLRWRSTFSGWLRVARHGPLLPPPESLQRDIPWPVERWPFSRVMDLGFRQGRLEHRQDITDQVLAWEMDQWERICQLDAEYGGLHAMRSPPELFPLLHECREDLWGAAAEAEHIKLVKDGKTPDA